jgi:hypothetical protein
MYPLPLRDPARLRHIISDLVNMSMPRVVALSVEESLFGKGHSELLKARVSTPRVRPERRVAGGGCGWLLTSS